MLWVVMDNLSRAFIIRAKEGATFSIKSGAKNEGLGPWQRNQHGPS
jgi:hypothetical protein